MILPKLLRDTAEVKEASGIEILKYDLDDILRYIKNGELHPWQPSTFLFSRIAFSGRRKGLRQQRAKFVLSKRDDVPLVRSQLPTSDAWAGV